MHTISSPKVTPMLNQNRRQTLTKSAETHRANLQKNLQRRLDAARARGDEQLIRLLEAEAHYIS